LSEGKRLFKPRGKHSEAFSLFYLFLGDKSKKEEKIIPNLLL
jgi:hypothetical protein